MQITYLLNYLQRVEFVVDISSIHDVFYDCLLYYVELHYYASVIYQKQNV